MTYRFNEDQEELRQLVRRFLAEKSPSEEVRRIAESSHSRDDAVWMLMADQLGLQGIAIPEEYGGAGFGPVELGIVLEEMGRRLLVAPYLSTVALAGQALVAAPDEAARRRWLPGIAEGSLTATLAVTDDGESWDPGRARTIARREGDRWALSGTKSYVVDGHTSGLLLVVARVAEGGIGLFAVEADAAGLTATALEAVDLTRDLAEVVLDGTPATRIEGVDLPLLMIIQDQALAALACEQVGGAARCLDMAVEYASLREQFGKPIGSFQAIKHKAADLLLEVESAKAAAYQASAMARGGRESELASTLAKAWCSETYVHAAKENLQIHGGIGFTWEHDAHLYLRRATSSDALFGAAGYHRDRLATLIGI